MIKATTSRHDSNYTDCWGDGWVGRAYAATAQYSPCLWLLTLVFLLTLFSDRNKYLIDALCLGVSSYNFFFFCNLDGIIAIAANLTLFVFLTDNFVSLTNLVSTFLGGRQELLLSEKRLEKSML